MITYICPNCDNEVDLGDECDQCKPNTKMTKPMTCGTCGKMTLELERCTSCDFWVCPECRVEDVCRECTDNYDECWEEGGDEL